jgi:hypothetical protein
MEMQLILFKYTGEEFIVALEHSGSTTTTTTTTSSSSSSSTYTVVAAVTVK